ncbi:carboxypeptidase-like regulatory domain-containing protein [Ferruginibacter sp. SUN106]|uniref:carboxypeptidase-like regulatory domain-containing protein n=1 Tax=Ferruginibacter sp. SUN106 TaxID=2978348 RepID=UPI003D35BF0D
MKFVFTVFFAAIFFVSYSQIQIISIEGVVKDFEGAPINGATVRSKHTSPGTSTSSNGTFRLDGLKPGDTLVFTSVAWQKAYFVVQRKYNRLNFRLLRDTLQIFVRENKNSTYFLVSGAASDYSRPYRVIDFDETLNPVTEVKKKDESYIFTKVEVNPYFYTSYPDFADSLTDDINKLKMRNRPKKPANILVYLWVKGDNKIEVNSITGNVKDEVKEIIKKRFQSIPKIYSAIQNGKTINVLGFVKIQIDITDDKKVMLKMVNT